jgi:hypothetical protein
MGIFVYRFSSVKKEMEEISSRLSSSRGARQQQQIGGTTTLDPYSTAMDSSKRAPTTGVRQDGHVPVVARRGSPQPMQYMRVVEED